MKHFICLLLCLALVRLPVNATEKEKLVALTFDDGPSGKYTQRLLDGLDEKNVKATFFLCGYRIEQYPALTQRIYLDGHEIGLHGYSHKTLKSTCRQGAEREISKTMEALPVECKITFFRSPGGLCSKEVTEVAKEKGLSLLHWSVDPKDWAINDAITITNKVVSQVQDGDIVLLHDMSDSSVDAAFAIIDQLKAKGFRFVTASQLAAEKNFKLSPGETYRQFRS